MSTITVNRSPEDASLAREIDQMLDAPPANENGTDATRVPRVSFAPPVNIAADREHIYVEFALPGVDPDSVQVTTLRNILRIEGAKPADTESGRRIIQRRPHGGFARNVALPARVDPDESLAVYKNGLLRITLRIESSEIPRTIDVLPA